MFGLGNMGYSWSLFKSLGDQTQRIRESLHKQIPLRDFIFSIILIFVIVIYQMNVSTHQTEISITCGNDQPRLVVFSGRHVESLEPGCKGKSR